LFPHSTANSADVHTGTFFAFIAGHQTVVYIKVRIFDDILVEGTEEFGIQLSIPDHHKANGVKLGVPSRATVSIKDGKFVILIFLSVLQTCTCINYCKTYYTVDERPHTTSAPTKRPPTTKPPTTRPPVTVQPTPCKSFIIVYNTNFCSFYYC